MITETIFDNTEIAFALKSDSELERAYFLFKMISIEPLVRIGTAATNFAIKAHLPIEGLIRSTVFDHFCGGVNEEDCLPVIDNMFEKGVSSVLDYSVEGKENDLEFDKAMNTTLNIIDFAKEMLKHGLISNEMYWNKFKDMSDLSFDDLDDLIYESILIKKQVVDIDPLEVNLRKTLNFGHTLGHAIESYFLSNPDKPDLLHGEAIAIGIVLVSYISTQLVGLPIETTNDIKNVFRNYYGVVPIEKADYAAILQLLKYDKKNEHGHINFVLLEAIGRPKINCLVDDAIILDAFKFYKT